MKEQEKILIALRTEKYSDSIFSLVKLLSKGINIKVVMLHVFDEQKKGDTKLEDAVEKLYDKFENQNVTLSQRMVKFGEFEKVVVETADNVNAGMIVMSKDVDGKQLDPAIPHILKNTDYPVWSVNNDATQEVKEIICPVDFSNTSTMALESSLALAKQLKSELIVTTVADEKESVSEFIQSSEEEFTKEVYETTAKKLDKFLEDIDDDGLKLTKKTTSGDVLDELNKIINASEKPLLVIGTHGRSGLEKKLIGSVTEKIIDNVTCSFLAIKSKLSFI